MELTLVGLQASGKSTFVDVVACGSVRRPCLLCAVLRMDIGMMDVMASGRVGRLWTWVSLSLSLSLF